MKKSSMACLAISVALLAVCATAQAAVTPKEQKAIVLTANGGPEVLKLQTVPVLEPGKNQVLIKVYAAAVNPVDWKIRQGMVGMGAGTAPGGGAFSPSILGMDVAGIVEKVGEGVTSPRVGDPVSAWIGRGGGVTGLNGGNSQYVVAPAANVIPKPKNLTYSEASGLGTAGITGNRAITAADVQKGQRVFINGIAGGVGSAAAQLAKARGAYVLGTASAKHNAFLKRIGVDEVIDYTKVKFEEAVKQPVDVVIETVGAETATRALKIIKKGGKLISVAGSPSADACAAAGVICPAGGGPGANGPSEGQLLAEVGKLASEGKYKVNVDATFPLEKTADAQEENRNGGTSGKIIIVVDAAQANRK